jgi:hypothetical protein
MRTTTGQVFYKDDKENSNKQIKLYLSVDEIFVTPEAIANVARVKRKGDDHKQGKTRQAIIPCKSIPGNGRKNSNDPKKKIVSFLLYLLLLFPREYIKNLQHATLFAINCKGTGSESGSDY